MHIQWGWIKQRPHFLALELAKKFKVSIFTLSSFKLKPTKNSCENNNIEFNTLNKIPFSKNKIINKFNKFVIQIQVKKYLKHCDIIWLTHPFLFYYIKDRLSNKHKLIYDCMDNALEFSDVKNNNSFMSHIKEQERALLARADHVFFSSQVLANVVDKRNENQIKNCEIINNALQPSSIVECSIPLEVEKKILENKKLFILGYFGAVSEWFDFELIKTLLNRNENICIMLLGPSDCVVPEHTRIIQLGSVEHKFLYSISQYFDALIMPFKVNDLIKSVDPVKLYEYIAFERPVIACKYKETEKFMPHVHLYSNIDELQNIIELIKSDANPIVKQLENFISNNSWSKRADEIIKVLLRGEKG